MNKKVLSLFLSFVMMFSMLATAVPVHAVSSEPAITLSVTADKTEAKPGDKVTYQVILGPVNKWADCEFTFVIPDGLQYESATVSDTVASHFQGGWTESTKRFVVYGGNYTSESNTLILTVVCSVKDSAAGTSPVVSLYDPFFCDTSYEDYAMTNYEPSVSIQVSAPHEHEFEEKWSWNETNHWHASTCGHDVKSGEEAHHGGTATCTTQAVCVDCGQSYGAFADHNYGTKVEAKPEVHETDKLEAGVAAHFYCDDCDTYFTEGKVETTLAALTGKTPEHSYGEWVNTDPENHWKACSCGLKANEGSHTYDDAKDTSCNDCGYVRTIAHEHEFEEKWSWNETNHWHASTCGHADVKSGEEAHHGGTATCTTKAVCVDCGQSYGAFADHNYGTKVEAKPEVHETDKLEAGVAAHFYCDVCEKYFTEERVETTLEDLTGKTPEHSYGEWVNTDPENHWKECSCGLKANEGKHAYDNILDAECNDCGHEREVVVPEVKLNTETLSLEVEETETLAATVTPEGLEGYTLEWTSDATDVATVDENGKVTAVAKGEANITVTLVLGTLAKTTISDTCVVTVTEPEPEVPATTSVTVSKVWDVPETFDRADLPESVSVVLMANGEFYGEPVTLNEENDWTCTWTELPVAAEDGKAIEYAVDEVEVPEGYEKTITDAEVPAGIGYVITNTLKETEPEVETYTVNFDSQGGSAVESQTIEEGGKVTKPADPTKEGFNFIKWTFEDKDWDFDYAVTGNMTLVAVWEEEEPEVPATTAVTVVKEWNAPEGTVLPESVEVYLLANGQEVTDSRTVLDEGNEWTYTWTELSVAAEDGTTIVYTVDEVEVEGYEKTIGEALETDTGIEIAITNTLIEEEPEVPETVTVAGTKTWVGDEEAVRPERIIVNLLVNGEAMDEREVTKESQWTFNFGALPKYDESGAEIEYSVQEEEVEGYTATYDGYNITNTLKEEDPEDPTKPTYGITVNNGKSYTGAGVEISAAEEGTKITIKANEAPEGKEFDKWVVNNGTITLADATKAETTFDMPAERVQVTATYKDKVVTPPADDDNDDNKDDVNKPSDDDKEDESKPSDTNKPATDTESPKTGDTSNIFMWFAVLFVSGFALVGFLLFGKRRRA